MLLDSKFRQLPSMQMHEMGRSNMFFFLRNVVVTCIKDVLLNT